VSDSGSVLAYLFWHRPRDPAEAADYESALVAFHRSLARSRPAGVLASACYRIVEVPWLGPGPAYEDWYVLEDYAALGVLNAAAVGRGHRSSHDAAARRSDTGAGALYALLEGEAGAEALAQATLAVWVERPQEVHREALHAELATMLGDGMERWRGSLWRRQLVLGPAPEYCLVGQEAPSGTRSSRLPAGWSASILRREMLYGG
jgi:hypothetical protein